MKLTAFHNFKSVFGFMIVSLIFFGAINSYGMNATEIFKRINQSVYAVVSYDRSGKIISQGSAVAISPESVITNYHVIKNALTIKIYRLGKYYNAIVIRTDKVKDLCQLFVSGHRGKPAKINPKLPYVGERIYALGTPKGLELTITEGLVSGIRNFRDFSVIQLSAAISSGSSGGGLFDANGELIGITTFQEKDGQNLNFAIPSSHIAGLLESPQSGKINSKESQKAMARVSGWGKLSWGMSIDEVKNVYPELIKLDPPFARDYAYPNLIMMGKLEEIKILGIPFYAFLGFHEDIGGFASIELTFGPSPDHLKYCQSFIYAHGKIIDALIDKYGITKIDVDDVNNNFGNTAGEPAYLLMDAKWSLDDKIITIDCDLEQGCPPTEFLGENVCSCKMTIRYISKELIQDPNL